MKILILTEGSKKYGLGHVSRMLAIYEAFEYFGNQVKMIVKGNESVFSLLKDINFQIIDWQENILKININTDIFVIDSYTAGKEIYDYLSKNGKMCIYLDDFKRLDYPKGIVVNGTLYAKELNYPKRKDIIYLLGTKYLPLRKEFWFLPKKKIKDNIEEVLVMFGGDDIKNVTPRVIEFLARNYPNYHYKVVIGKAFNQDNIKNILSKVKNLKNFEIVMFPSGKDILNLMLKSDIGIIAAGLMTLYESMCVGLPVITITTMENQVDVLNRSIRTGFIEHAGWYNDINLFENIKANIEKLKNKKIREEKYKIGRRLIDGKGALRIVKRAMELLGG